MVFTQANQFSCQIPTERYQLNLFVWKNKRGVKLLFSCSFFFFLERGRWSSCELARLGGRGDSSRFADLGRCDFYGNREGYLRYTGTGA